MQQYYPRNVDSDPVRMSMKSHDLLPKKNIFSMMKNNNNKGDNQFNNSNTKQPDLYRENIFSENYNRNDGLSEEMIEKDKKIQELEFKLQQTEYEIDGFKSKLGMIKKYEEENKNLSLKLREEYEKNKEIVLLKNKITFFEKAKKEDNKIIKNLKEKINLIESENEEGITFTDIIDDDDDGEDPIVEEEIKSIDYEEIYKKTLEEEAKNNEKYKNDKLKTIICKYVGDKNSNKIDEIFIRMKIEEDIEITKTLITTIIKELSE